LSRSAFVQAALARPHASPSAATRADARAPHRSLTRRIANRTALLRRAHNARAARARGAARPASTDIFNRVFLGTDAAVSRPRNGAWRYGRTSGFELCTSRELPGVNLFFDREEIVNGHQQ
jgi:hypothetical protein